ncbi:MAG: cyclic nucleotide-binding domain-containing protein [Rhodospirillum sp.]|nr:cyclic nucleotide-binding domain-containing protein [Rhodospirillum sp.]MCF8489557.1 cyclic nucleotide-binding domain-containing protein [Rhodospirillum sp.]MCF8499746.1 cyclic nucleotide-binding domain-containing protein [Rhodospirillum sp.]
MQNNIFKFIWDYSKKEQIVLSAMTVFSFPVLYLTLDIPKKIINNALNNPSAEKVFLGIPLDPLSFLLALCLTFLALVVFNGLLKMWLNTLKGVVGERLVRRLRYMLLERMVRFPLTHFHEVSQGELSSSVVAEVDPLAPFIGDALAQPLFQGGTMITVLIFMFMQDPLLGLATIAMVPIQAYIIPKLQYQVKILGKERVRRARKLAESIGETSETIREIRTNGTQSFVLANIANHLGGIFEVRLEIYKKKYFVKFLNNFMNQVTPFFFYAIGGYLVLDGDLSIGALVAAIAAQKEMSAPWKELLQHYQNSIDSQLKYEQIVEQYSPGELVPYVPDSEPHPETLHGSIVLENVTWSNEYGDRIVDHVSLTVPAGAFVGVSSTNQLALRRLGELLVGLEAPVGGRVTVAGAPLSGMPSAFVGRRIAYAGPEPRMISGTVMQNVNYGLRHRPPVDPVETLTQDRRKQIEEALATGNATERVDEPWTDFPSVGTTSWDDLAEWWIRCLEVLGDDQFIYQQGLRQTFDLVDYPSISAPLVRARFRLHREIRRAKLTHAIGRFNRRKFNEHARIYENILFGLPNGGALSLDGMGGFPALINLMDRHGFLRKAIEIGAQLAKRLIATYGEDPEEGPDLHYPYLTEAKYQVLRDTVFNAKQLRKAGKPLSPECEAVFTELFLWITPSREEGAKISDDLQRRILLAREEILSAATGDFQNQVAHFNARTYHPRLNVSDNLLFGRLATEDPLLINQLRHLTDEALKTENARTFLMVLAALSQVGVGGSRLPVLVKQKVQYLRALIKKPDIFVCHQALDGLERPARAEIYARTRALMPEMTLIILEQNLPEDAVFDSVHYLREGRLVSEIPSVARGTSEEPMIAGGGGRDEDAQRAVALSPLLSDLPRQTRLRIAAESEWRVIPQGEYVFRSGEASEFLFILVEGQAELVSLRAKDEPLHIAYLCPPETTGETELLAGTRRFSSVRAVTDLRVLRINGSIMTRLATEDPTLALKVLKVIGRRLTSEPPLSDEAVEGEGSAI